MEKGFKFKTSKNELDLSTLIVEVSSELFKKEIDKQVDIYRPKVQMKGFRVGHAPKDIILSRHKEALESASCEALVEAAWSEFQDNEKKFSLGTPKLAKMDKENDGLLLTYEYYEMPEVQVPDFSKLSLEKDVYEVDDACIENSYNMYIKRFSQFVESEDKADIGDRVSVKIEFSDSKNKKYNKEHTVVVSDDENESVYSKNSLGLKKNESKELSSFLNDSEVKFTMTITKVEKPDMKDDSSDEDKQKVKDSLKDHLKEKANMKAENEFTNSGLYDSLVSAVTVDIPKGYLEEQIESNLKDLEASILRQKTTMEDYLLAVGKKYSDIKDEYSASVKKQITFDLIMAKIADINKDSITVSESKVQEYAEKMYQYQNYMGLSKRPKDEQQNILHSIMHEAQNKATSEAIIEYVKSNITIKEKKAVSYIPTDQDLWMGMGY